jgi:hypothetical protein
LFKCFPHAFRNTSVYEACGDSHDAAKYEANLAVQPSVLIVDEVGNAEIDRKTRSLSVRELVVDNMETHSMITLVVNPTREVKSRSQRVAISVVTTCSEAPSPLKSDRRKLPS